MQPCVVVPLVLGYHCIEPEGAWWDFMYGGSGISCAGCAVLVTLYMRASCPAFSQEEQQVSIEGNDGFGRRSGQSDGCLCDEFWVSRLPCAHASL